MTVCANNNCLLLDIMQFYKTLIHRWIYLISFYIKKNPSKQFVSSAIITKHITISWQYAAVSFANSLITGCKNKNLSHKTLLTIELFSVMSINRFRLHFVVLQLVPLLCFPTFLMKLYPQTQFYPHPRQFTLIFFIQN